MDRNSIVGDWSIGFREFSIEWRGQDLYLVCPDAPAGFEGRLVDVSEDRIRVQGGGLHGAELLVTGEGVSLGGRRPLLRLDRPVEAPVGSGLTLPPMTPDPEEEEAFMGLWNFLAHPSRAAEAEIGGLDLSRFVQWLAAQRLALFHGSNRLDLDRLDPSPWPTVTMGTVEASDIVYASEDALCSMFMALVEESTTRRGARHRVERFRGADGGHLDLYQFSLPNAAHAGLRPGGLYLLPRERFDPVALYPGGPRCPEWFTPEPVRPLACLIVTPDDFPFRDAVGLAENA